jgi:hypothetical protein
MGERIFIDRDGNVWSVWEAPTRLGLNKRTDDDVHQGPAAQIISFENETTGETKEGVIRRPLADVTDDELQIALDRSGKAPS